MSFNYTYLSGECLSVLFGLLATVLLGCVAVSVYFCLALRAASVVLAVQQPVFGFFGFEAVVCLVYYKYIPASLFEAFIGFGLFFGVVVFRIYAAPCCIFFFPTTSSLCVLHILVMNNIFLFKKNYTNLLPYILYIVLNYTTWS
jgi:hypothetical protein